MFKPSIQQQIDYLSGFALDQRIEQLRKILALRTRYLTVCLEDIYQSQNASAVLRTCDAFGIQDVHIIESENRFTIHPQVAMGTHKWLNLYKYKNLQMIDKLRANGYRIVATTPRDNSVALADFDLLKGKTALFFGTELTGLSNEMMQQADEFVHIPMYGFVESFNISVSVSIILYQLTTKLRELDIAWQLPDEEYNATLFQWLKASIRGSDMLLKRFLEHK